MEAKTRKKNSATQACSFFSPFLGILLLALSSITLFHMFVHAVGTLEVPVHRSGIGGTLKKVIVWAFRKLFFS